MPLGEPGSALGHTECAVGLVQLVGNRTDEGGSVGRMVDLGILISKVYTKPETSLSNP